MPLRPAWIHKSKCLEHSAGFIGAVNATRQDIRRRQLVSESRRHRFNQRSSAVKVAIAFLSIFLAASLTAVAV